MATPLYSKDGETITMEELIGSGMASQQRIGRDVMEVPTAILLSEPGFFKTGLPKDVNVVCFKKPDKTNMYNAYNTQRHIKIFSTEIFKILDKEQGTNEDLKTHLGIEKASELQIVIFPRGYAAQQLFDPWTRPIKTNIFRAEHMKYLLGDGTKEKIKTARAAAREAASAPAPAPPELSAASDNVASAAMPNNADNLITALQYCVDNNKTGAQALSLIKQFVQTTDLKSFIDNLEASPKQRQEIQGLIQKVKIKFKGGGSRKKKSTRRRNKTSRRRC
jgi:hypothetical protein